MSCVMSCGRAPVGKSATIGAMDHDAFTCLYLHATALAELGGMRFSDLAAADDAGAVRPALAGIDGPADPLPPAGGAEDTYLAGLYAGRAQLAGRIEAVTARAGLARLQQLAERLPPDLPSLLAPLDGKGLSAWLARYEQGNEDLHDIVQRIRCADL